MISKEFLADAKKDTFDDTRELVSVLPISFTVDDNISVSNPIGEEGNKLFVKAVVSTSLKSEIYPLISIVSSLGISIVDIVHKSQADYYTVSNNSLDRKLGCVINMGGDVTTVSIFNKGIMIKNSYIPLGSSSVDKDISFVYKLSLKDASKVREELGLASRKNARAQETMEVVNNLGEKIKIDQYELSSLMMSRLHEMLNIVKNEINYLTKKEISYIIVSGGLSEQRDFDIEVESVFGPIAFIGKNNYIGARNNKFASAIGMIKYFDSKLKLRDKDFSVFSDDDLDRLISNGNKKR